MLPKRAYRIMAITLLFCMLVVSFSGCRRTPSPRAPLPAEPPKPKLDILGFYSKGWGDGTYGWPALQKHYQNFSVISPLWYSVRADGTLGINEFEFEPQVYDFIKAQPNLKLMPLINNDRGNTESLTNPAIRSSVVKSIVKRVLDNNYIGVNIDFQLLPAEVRDGLSTFIHELYQQLKANQKLLAVSVMPKEDHLEEIGAAYDYPAIAQNADFVTLMAYDQHQAVTGPGAIASIDWVERNIQTALKSIPKEKLMLCVAAYGYDWPIPFFGGPIESVGSNEALWIAKNKGATIEWSEQAKSPFFNYWSGTQQHQIWFESGQSASYKVALARKYGLRGIAVWRIGFEADDYWTFLQQAASQ